VKWGRGGTPAAAGLQIKAHVLAILGGFWDRLLLDLPLRKPRVPMCSMRGVAVEELGDEMRGGSAGSSDRRGLSRLCCTSSLHPAARSGSCAGN